MNYTEVINVSSAANSTRIDYSTIHMHNTDTFIEESMVPNKEDAVHGHVSDTAPLPSERGETSTSSLSTRCLSSEMLKQQSLRFPT